MRPFKAFDQETERIATLIVDCAYQVHVEMGAGLLESIYEKCLIHELTSRGLTVGRQAIVPVVYKGVQIDETLRLDLLVNDKIIIEIKSVQQIEPIHRSQLITYLKLTKLRLGFLINFNVTVIKDGIERIAL